jgi:WD40 repeat protein
VTAFNRLTGELVWKVLDDRPAYSAPIVITAGGTRQLILWTADTVTSLEPATGKVLWQIPYKATFDPAQAVASPVLQGDQLLCLAAWYRGSLMLKLAADQPAATILWKTRSRPTTTMATPFFGDEKHFYAVDGDGSLCCCDSATGDQVWATREATSERFGQAHLTPSGERVFLFNQTGHLILARLTPAGYQEFGRALLVEPTAGFRAGNAVAWAHPAYANKHVFARNDRELVCASLAAEDYTAVEPSVPAAPIASQPIAGTAGPEGAMTLSIALSPDGQTLALGSGWGHAKLLELATGKELPGPKPHNDWVCSVAFSPSGKLLVSAGGSEFAPARNNGMTSAEIKLWDLDATAEREKLTGHTNKVFSAVFSPDGATLATGSADRTVRLWDIATLKERSVLQGHTDAIAFVAFSHDGSRLASASWDRTIKLWNAATRDELGTLKGHEDEVLAVAFSSDGGTLATGSADWTVRLWDLETKTERHVLKGHGGSVACVAFSPDGQTLATGSGDETIRLWNAGTGAEQATLRGHKGGVTALVFAADGKSLYSAAIDDAVRVWKLSPEK